MSAAAHGAAVDLRHPETGAVGAQDNVRRPRHANAAAQHEAVQRHNDGLGVSVYCPEGIVVALVHRDDFLRVRRQLLDIDAGAKTFSRRADNNHPHGIVGAQGIDLGGDGEPAGAVEGVYRRLVQDHLGDAIGDGCFKGR